MKQLNCQQGLEDIDVENKDAVLIVAPHMYSGFNLSLDLSLSLSRDLSLSLSGRFKDLEWCFSSPVVQGQDDEEEEEEEEEHAPWAVSTFQIRQFVRDEQKRLLVFTHTVLYALLMQKQTSSCENRRCILNNSDSMFEQETSSSLLVCAGCLRMLHLSGVITDVPAFLQSLSTALSKDPFRRFCHQDLLLLKECGFG